MMMTSDDVSVPAMNMNAHRKLVALAAGVALVLITIVAHSSAINGAWLGDDMQQLSVVRDHSLFELLTSPEAWRSFTKYFFTPFLAFQYQFDVWLFGYNPRYFLWHNLIDLAAAVVFSYALWSRRFPPLLAFLACAGFILATPAFSISMFLHSRHYIAGLIFAIASIHVHQNAYRKGMTGNLLASAALFFMALACKELYAMVLPYFVLRSWRTPAFRKTLVLYPLALAIFAAWRGAMLGGFVGAYDYGGTLLERINALACIHRAIFGSDAVAAACLGVVLCVAVYHRLLNPKRLFHFAVLLVAAYAPLLFATFILYDFGSALRLGFFPAWLFFLAMGYFATLLWEKGHRGTAVVILLGFIAATTTFSAKRIGEFRDVYREEIAQATLIRTGGPTAAFFLSPRGLSSVNANIHRRLAQLDGRSPANAVASMDDVVPGVASYWAYDREHCRCMRRLSSREVQEALARLPHAPAAGTPLALLATFRAERGKVAVTVAPDDGQSGYFVTVPGMAMPPWDSADITPSRLPTERMDWSRVRVYRIRQRDLAGRNSQDDRDLPVAFSPFFQIPWTGTVQWDRGVFLAAKPPIGGNAATCHVDSPAPGELHLAARSSLEIAGRIDVPVEVDPDSVPHAVLDGQNGETYVAHLYRAPVVDEGQARGHARVGARVLDADLARVSPGTYRLRLGIGEASCDTGVTLIVSR